MKSQGLQINFLVKFILSIVIFGLGVLFIWNIFDDSIATLLIPGQEIDKKIQALNCQPTEMVCVGASTIEISGGEIFLLDVRVFNNFASDVTYNSSVYLLYANSTAYPSSDANISLQPKNFQITVKAKSSNDYSLILQTTKQAPKGEYSIQIKLEPPTGSGLSNQIKRINLFVK